MKEIKKKFREDVAFRRTSAIIGLVILVAVLFVGIHLRRAVVYERMIQDVCDGAYSTAEQEITKLPKDYKECGQIRPYIAIRETYATYIGAQCSKILKSLNELDAFQDERLSENYTAFRADVSQKEKEYQQDKQAAAAVEKKIAAIGTVTTESEQAIQDAQSAYDALNSEASTLVSLNSRETLQNAHTLLAAAKVSALIDQIGTVTLESNEKIQTAQTAYDALTADEKEAVKNADTLASAKTRLEELEKKKQKRSRKLLHQQLHLPTMIFLLYAIHPVIRNLIQMRVPAIAHIIGYRVEKYTTCHRIAQRCHDRKMFIAAVHHRQEDVYAKYARKKRLEKCSYLGALFAKEIRIFLQTLLQSDR